MKATRTSIARALAGEQPLLLCDEPTGNLSQQAGLEVMQTLRRVCDEDRRTVLLVTHNPRDAAFADVSTDVERVVDPNRVAEEAVSYVDAPPGGPTSAPLSRSARSERSERIRSRISSASETNSRYALLRRERGPERRAATG